MPVPPMEISDYGVSFIAGWEGVRLQMYDDGGPGIGNATIGIGHLIHLGPIDGSASEAPFVGGITLAEAYRLFRADLASRVAWVNANVARAMTAGEFDACVDFTYNCGVGAFQRIAPVVNARGNFCAAIAPWVLPAWASEALKRRRGDECRIYYGGTANTPPPPIPEGDEMWDRHNEVANNAYWVGAPGQPGRHTFGPNERATIQLRVDLPRVMALNPSAIDFDLYTEGGAVEVRDGNGAFAIVLSERRRDAIVRVVPQNGAIQFWAGPTPVTVQLGVAGYVH